MADSKSNSNQTKASPNSAPSPRQLANNTNKLETITNLPNETKPILSDYNNNNQIINSNNNNQPVQPQMPIQSVNPPDTSNISSMQTYPSRYLQPISNSNILHHQYQQQLQNSLHVDALNGSINNIAYSSDMYTNGYSNTYQNMNNTINNSYRNNNYYKMSNSDYSVNLNVSINEPVQPSYVELNNNNINKQNNLNGLLNVVQSVSYNGIQNMQSIALNYDSKKQVLPAPPQPPTQLIQAPYAPSFIENKNEITKINNFKSQNNQLFEAYLNSICRNCFNLPKLFCKCNVSKIALKKLYKNYTSFDSNDANLEPHKHHHHHHQHHNQTDFQATLSVSANLSQLKRSPQIESNKKFLEKSKSDTLVNSNNYVVNNERFVHYENVDSNTEKIFEVL